MQEETQTFVAYLAAINAWRRRFNFSLRAIGILRSFLLAMVIFLLWAWLKPEAWVQQVVLFFFAFIASLVLSWSKLFRTNSAEEWLTSLEMKYTNANPSAFQLPRRSQLDPIWTRNIEEDMQAQRIDGKRILIAKSSSLILPALLLVFFYHNAGQAWDRAISSMERAAMSLTYGAHLRVVEGSPQGEKGAIALSATRSHEVTVLEQNLIELSVTASPDATPLLQLKDKEGKILQTFKLLREGDARSDDSAGKFSLRFAQAEDADLSLSTISSSRAVASIRVKKLPVPKVTLSSLAREGEAWADDKPLPLIIDVKAENPLQSVQLLIKAGERESRELVSEVMAQDKKTLNTRYSLALESYVEQDVQDLEIVAEALDRAVPVPLVGRSKPIFVKVASAYGRYKMALESLKEVKSMLDGALQSQKALDAKALAELTDKVQAQADESPFFDGLDRQVLNQLRQSFEKLQAKNDMSLALTTSEQLNRFLFEHESLDDRERDRDFFIAARTLSRVLEQDKKERKLEVKEITKKLQEFLRVRQTRWAKRVERLPSNARPESWREMEALPMERAMPPIAEFDAKGDTRQAIQSLSKNVDRYKRWIEELEAKEDSARKQEEEARQQGLADARNVLRELQRRQGSISSKLDRAAERKPEELEENWNNVRMDQNSNIKGTKELEAQLRSLSPEAGERIRAAGEAMEATVSAGGEKSFVEAETASDAAGRLLQQADNAARQSQQENQQRGRRRRVSNDQYYGNQITGGDVDLRRNYQVNRRYREDVLNDIRDAKRQESSEETDTLLEDYLRRVIR